ncbi:MAG: MarR family transcriptional regulator [Chryseotalea sp. WA131a]|nr:MAG: MarR family transcriptional regulator [Chryseotalea sp. WA131a]
MPLEQDIRQEKFASEFQKMAVNIMFTSSWLNSGNIARFRPHGITPEQFNVLRILRGSHPHKMRLADVTSRMIDKSSNCTRLVEKLRQKGLVTREICEGNRRQVDIGITDNGLLLLKKIDAQTASWVTQLKNVTQVEAKEINRLLDKLRGG